MTFGWFFAFAATTALFMFMAFVGGFIAGIESARSEKLATAVKKSLPREASLN